MVEWHIRDDKKPSGGKRNSANARTKLLSSRGGVAALTKTDSTVEENRIETKKGLGKTKKVRALALKHANVSDGHGKTIKAQIISVKENNANRLFSRANISTKGAIIRVKVDENEKLAIVKNRPGQEGVVNAVLVEQNS